LLVALGNGPSNFCSQELKIGKICDLAVLALKSCSSTTLAPSVKEDMNAIFANYGAID